MLNIFGKMAPRTPRGVRLLIGKLLVFKQKNEERYPRTCEAIQALKNAFSLEASPDSVRQQRSRQARAARGAKSATKRVQLCRLRKQLKHQQVKLAEMRTKFETSKCVGGVSLKNGC